jgi:hypothetical protein
MRDILKALRPFTIEIVVILCGLSLTILAPRWWLVDAGSDDLLYVRQALSLKSGDWLGSFAEGGGLKLPGFQIYLAILSFSKIPFFVGVFAIQVLGALLIRDYFEKNIEGKFYKTVFAFCVLAPAMFSANNSRLLRDGFYSALLVLLFGISLQFFIRIKQMDEAKTKNFAWPLISFATVSTWIAFTREETIAFIFFDLVLIASVVLVARWNRSGVMLALKFMMVCLIFFGVSNFAIQNMNEKYYKTPSASFLQSGPLIDLIDEWSRVKPISDNPRILISAAQRERIYKEIPSIGSKSEKLESYLGWYSGASCGQANVCDDIGSGWTFWGLFYGVTEGDGRINGDDFNAEVRSMTRAVQSFCQSNRENCDTSFRLPTIGSPDNLLKIFFKIPTDLLAALIQEGNNEVIPASSGNDSNAELFRQLTPIGGPSEVWSGKPLGLGTTANLAMLICLILLAGGLKNDLRHLRRRTPLTVILAPVIFLGILILFRSLVTSVISVVGWNVSATNYMLPNNVLFWILLSQLPLIVHAYRCFAVSRSKNSAGDENF